MSEPLRRTCVECKAGRTVHESGRCLDCRRGEIALTGGEWVLNPQTRILEWRHQPAGHGQAEQGLSVLQDLLACYCGAGVADRCKGPDGKPTMPHAARVIPRRCACGNPIASRAQYCHTCRREARRETYRLREQKNPTRARRSSTGGVDSEAA